MQHSLSSKLCEVLSSHCLSQNPLKLLICFSLSQEIPLKLQLSLNVFRTRVFSSVEKCPSHGFRVLRRKSSTCPCTGNAKKLLHTKLSRVVPALLHLSTQSTWIEPSIFTPPGPGMCSRTEQTQSAWASPLVSFCSQTVCCSVVIVFCCSLT